MIKGPVVTKADTLAMPPIIYGTAWKKEATASLVVQAVQAGFRGIDTACQPKHYSEAGVGEALSVLADQGVSRESLYVQTKFTPVSGQDPKTTPYDASLPVADQVAQSFAASQQNLCTNYVDALILHSPLQPHQQLISAWRAMEVIYNNGGARRLGISNCYALSVLQDLYRDADIKPALIQNRFYPQTGYDGALRRWSGERDIVYQSFWTLTANRHVLASLAAGRMTEKYGCEPAQILLRYVTQQGIVPLTGTTDAEHMRADLAMFSFTLNDDELAVIERCLKQS